MAERPAGPPNKAKVLADKGGADSATRQQLLEAALLLFARYGVEAVSIREITKAAGQANQSAVHYHFTDRDGLVMAVIDHVCEQLAPLQAQASAQLSAIAATRAPTVREVVTLGFQPLVQLHMASSSGRVALRFLSRLLWQSGTQAFDRMILRLWPYFQQQIVPHLEAALPHKPKLAVAVQSMIAVTTVIHMLADTRLLANEAVLGLDQTFRENPGQVAEYFLDFLVGGLTA